MSKEAAALQSERLWAAELERIDKSGLLRQLHRIKTSQDHRVRVEDREFINFSSNDYLGLCRSDLLAQAAANAARRWGCGSGASRLVSGSLRIHHTLEEAIASYKEEEAARIFTSGFQANLGLLQAAADERDTIYVDRFSHASLIDGVKLSGAKLRVYPHCDIEKLEIFLKKPHSGKVFVVTDSYFSMDGDIAPLDDLSDVCRRYEAVLIVDDAHASGVFGKNGRGLTEAFGLQGKIDIVTGTFSKAFGSQGGFVCGSHTLCELLTNKARTLIYTTGQSPVVSAVSLEAVKILTANSDYRERLWKNVEFIRKELTKSGFDLGSSAGPIIPVVIGDADKTVSVSKKLAKEGIWVPAIRPPTVPKGTSRLRITVSATHSAKDIEKLLFWIQKLGKEI